MSEHFAEKRRGNHPYSKGQGLVTYCVKESNYQNISILDGNCENGKTSERSGMTYYRYISLSTIMSTTIPRILLSVSFVPSRTHITRILGVKMWSWHKETFSEMTNGLLKLISWTRKREQATITLGTHLDGDQIIFSGNRDTSCSTGIEAACCLGWNEKEITNIDFCLKHILCSNVSK